MRCLIYADPHWSAYSSIVRSRGNKYSTRLENLIESINWVEEQASLNKCDSIICLGDFFDQASLNAEEMTALQDIKWANMKHYFIVGNHEMGRSNLEFSSTHLFNLCPNTEIIEDVKYIENIVFIPYILEENRKSLDEYLPNGPRSNLVIMSHNDIKDVRMGPYVSTTGFSQTEIMNNCKLFINGHLHNHMILNNKIVNLGNITGQNFSEDANRYKHQCLLYDTITDVFNLIENPYSFKFYKFEFNKNKTIEEIKERLNKVRNNSIITVKVDISKENEVKEYISTNKNIIESRVLLQIDTSNDELENVSLEDLSIDHIQKFIEYIKSEVGTSELIVDELNRIAEG